MHQAVEEVARLPRGLLRGPLRELLRELLRGTWGIAGEEESTMKRRRRRKTILKTKTWKRNLNLKATTGPNAMTMKMVTEEMRLFVAPFKKRFAAAKMHITQKHRSNTHYGTRSEKQMKKSSPSDRNRYDVLVFESRGAPKMLV
jgi:hypothetical protein